MWEFLIPFHEKPDTDVNPESFAASKFFNCELRIANCELVLVLGMIVRKQVGDRRPTSNSE
jgi:hypothetical protein